MAEWRFGRGWSVAELARVPFSPVGPTGGDRHPWREYFTESVLAAEAPGPPQTGGPFERARSAIIDYRFSDPEIVTGHFDVKTPLMGRRMLLEIKVLGLHYLCPVVVAAVRDEQSSIQTVFGFRYDTLKGHIEEGSEWFLLTKIHATGEVRFRIQAKWRPGEFPNWWSHFGFHLLARRYQRRWNEIAHARLRRVAASETGFRDLNEPASRHFLIILLLGVVAGLRSMSAPARLYGELYREGISGLFGSRALARLLRAMAGAELVIDKLPFTPARIEPVSLVARAGAGAATALSVPPPVSARAPVRLASAAVGAAAAVAAAYGAYWLRRSLTRGLRMPDLVVALAEDGVMALISTFALRRIPVAQPVVRGKLS